MVSIGTGLGHLSSVRDIRSSCARGRQARQIVHGIPRQFIVRALHSWFVCSWDWYWPERDAHQDNHMNQDGGQQSIACVKAGDPTGAEIERRAWGIRVRIWR